MEISSRKEEKNEEGRRTIFYLDQDEPAEAIMTSMNNESELSAGARKRSGSKQLKDAAVFMNSTKRTKKAEDDKITNTTKSQSFRKRWTGEEEIALLSAIIDFQEKTRKSPSDDNDGFYESFKKSVSFEVNLRRTMDKIRHLRDKYKVQEEDGVEPYLFKKNDKERFRLSKTIWGAEKIALRSVVKTEKVSEGVETKKRALFSSPNTEEGGGERGVESPIGVTQTDMFQESYLVQSIEILGVESVKQKWSVVPMETRKSVEEKLKSLYAKEVECKKLEEKLEAEKLECVNERKNLLNEVIPVITKVK